MKKSLLLLLAVALTAPVIAQLVTISGVNQIPQIGDTLRYKNINTFGFELSGTGPVTSKVWDLSALTDGSSLEFFYLDPAETPEYENFQSATLAEGSDQADGYFYYVSGNYYMARKGVTGDMVMHYADDSATVFTFPFTAGHNYTCTYSGMLYASGLDMDITGAEVEMDADAQGTLMLPNGTILEDVLRIHITEIFNGTYEIVEGMPTDVLTVEDDYYYWFHEDYTGAVLVYGVTTVESMGSNPEETEVLRYQPVIAGVGVGSATKQWASVYPNPASDRIVVDMPVENENYYVYNASGALVHTGNSQYIDVSSMATGVYCIVFENKLMAPVNFIIAR
ncbi:MAG TPA: T9SS type A sorting domain-containing protein [Bacteroidales bacterium]|nr:T9SS type A sorting domain-containing protein [Bacteroidales bacterium]HOE05567.1 T9SS type A sorting domain-containing protein [Bacteroidales bacterium]HQL69928.1 T9SS type A sorting domain-containing protein [Bacteroidales bacterium]